MKKDYTFWDIVNKSDLCLLLMLFMCFPVIGIIFSGILEDWDLLSLCTVALFVACVCFNFTFKKAKIFVEESIIVKANVTILRPSPAHDYLVEVTYEIDGISYTKKKNLFEEQILPDSTTEILVHPDNPRKFKISTFADAEPLRAMEVQKAEAQNEQNPPKELSPQEKDQKFIAMMLSGFLILFVLFGIILLLNGSLAGTEGSFPTSAFMLIPILIGFCIRYFYWGKGSKNERF